VIRIEKVVQFFWSHPVYIQALLDLAMYFTAEVNFLKTFPRL